MKATIRGGFVDQFLASQGIKHDSILAHLPDLSDDQCAIFSGGIVNGFGHAASDIDVLVLGGITHKPEQGLVSAEAIEEIFRLDTGHVININHISGETLRQLGGRMGQLVESALLKNVTAKLQQFNNNELCILDWVHSGHPIRNEAVFFQWQVELHTSLFPIYLYSYGGLRSAMFLQDARSLLAKGDTADGLWALRMSADFLAVSLLGSAGQVSVNAKWRLKKLRAHTNSLGDDVASDLIRFLTDWPIADAERTLAHYEQFYARVVEGAREKNKALSPLMQRMISEMV